MTNYVGELHHVENEKIVKKLHVKICNDQLHVKIIWRLPPKTKPYFATHVTTFPQHIEAKNFPMKLTL